MLFKNVTALLPDGFALTDVRVGSVIEAIGPTSDEGIDCAGRYLAPGYLDLHTHGAMGEDASDGSAAGLDRLCRYYPEKGVVGFLPTTMTISIGEIESALRVAAAHRHSDGEARILGAYMEGPFLSAKKKGAQAESCLKKPDAALFDQCNAAAGGMVRVVGVAPEEEGALPFIRDVSQRCTVSIAHSACGYDEAKAAIAAGARQMTHLFNAMEPLLHRAPGPIPAAAEAGIAAELICDGIHVHPAMVRLAFRLFPERILLISDSLRCTNLPEGMYIFGGQPIVLKDGQARMKDSGALAGSTIGISDAVANAVRFGIDPATALRSASLHPAKAIGMADQYGVLAEGRRADLVLLNPDFTLHSCYMDGQAVYQTKR